MYFPLLVDVRGRLAVVIGGGAVAERKVETLLPYGARIRLFSPTLTARLAQYAAEGKVEVHRRAYQPGDLEGAFLVFAATDHREINRQVFQEAVQRGQLVNVADRPEWCHFHVPAIFRRGKLQISISTAGASPAVAMRLRKQLEAQFDEAYAGYLDVLSELRGRVQQWVPDPSERQKILRMFAEREEWLDQYRREGHERVLQEACQWIQERLDENNPA